MSNDEDFFEEFGDLGNFCHWEPGIAKFCHPINVKVYHSARKIKTNLNRFYQV